MLQSKITKVYLLFRETMAQFVKTDVLKKDDSEEKLLMIEYDSVKRQIEDKMSPIEYARTTA